MSSTLGSPTGHGSVSNIDEQSLLSGPVESIVEQPHPGSGQPELTPDPAAGLPAALRAPDTSALREIAEATFGVPYAGRYRAVHTAEDGGAFSQESVISQESIIGGTDERVQVGDTTALPWRMNASLRITAADNSLWVGTAWFIGPHTLVTAGHCVFIHAPGTLRHGWVRSIEVMPGRNGAVLPYGSITSTSFRAVDGWTASPNQDFDYGAIIIPTELGNTVGGFGFGVCTDSELLSSTVTVSGYPGDKPTGTQWFDTSNVASVGTGKVFYTADTAGGGSGGPVYPPPQNGEYIAVAVHAYGGTTANSGTRIVQQIYDNLMAWKA